MGFEEPRVPQPCHCCHSCPHLSSERRVGYRICFPLVFHCLAVAFVRLVGPKMPGGFTVGNGDVSEKPANRIVVALPAFTAGRPGVHLSYRNPWIVPNCFVEGQKHF